MSDQLLPSTRIRRLLLLLHFASSDVSSLPLIYPRQMRQEYLQELYHFFLSAAAAKSTVRWCVSALPVQRLLKPLSAPGETNKPHSAALLCTACAHGKLHLTPSPAHCRVSTQRWVPQELHLPLPHAQPLLGFAWAPHPCTGSVACEQGLARPPQPVSAACPCCTLRFTCPALYLPFSSYAPGHILLGTGVVLATEASALGRACSWCSLVTGSVLPVQLLPSLPPFRALLERC